MIFINGELVGQGHQFDVDQLEVVTATIDLDDLIAVRNNPGFGKEAISQDKKYASVTVDFCICHLDGLCMPTSPVIAPTICRPEEEIALGPACWLWDYLRRSGCNGFFLPLSGGEPH